MVSCTAANSRAASHGLSSATKLLCTTLVEVELCFEELVQGRDTVRLRLLDVEHATVDVFARLLEFGFVCSNFLLDSEIVSSSLVQLSNASIVGKSSILELLAGRLET